MEQTLGKRIMSHRKKMGLTQDQLAERLGVTAQAVSKWENDQSCPDITMLPKLAEVFGVSTDELLGRERPQTVHETEVVDSRPDKECAKHRWELEWDSGRKAALWFAVLTLLTGGLLLLAKLLDWDTTFWEILWPCALVVFGLSGFLGKFSFFRLGCVLFGGYFLLDNLGILNFRLGGKLVFPAVLVIFGISLLIDALRKPKKAHFSVTHNGESIHKPPQSNNYEVAGDTFTYSASFGEQKQYVDLPTLRGGNIQISFGDYDVDLSGVGEIAPDCRMEASCSFGELTLLVPRRFRVQCDSSTAFAAVETDGQPDPSPAGTILLRANASFGQINVRYL